MLQSARILTIGIDRPLSEVAAFLAEPRNFPSWASGLADGLEPAADSSLLPQAGSEWLASTPHGCLRIRFSPANPYGVADHWVELEDGRVIYVPLRVVANGDGSTVALTLFHRPDMDAESFAADCDWVRRDLLTLRQVLGG
ncbi:SRPBCC family protein [Pseudomonas sp. GCM10022188]|uniref:SRPBCC family protein n=1 Tax=Pseudomonas TaxID=286 RepID=UPI001E569ABF|nr:SRPBCC family protein [Pseudomonas oryzagri]MCC6073622.1 SRPBCC family protein [Pseudomonas oryzagri]